jgi:hypothetical protein
MPRSTRPNRRPGAPPIAPEISALVAAGCGLLISVSVSTANSDDWIFNRTGSTRQTGDPQLGRHPSQDDDGSKSAPDIVKVSGSLEAQSETELLIRGIDQRLWRFARADLRDHIVTQPQSSWDEDALSAQMRRQYPEFEQTVTEHYLLLHNVDRDLAQQSARLLEQFHRGFFQFFGDIEFDAEIPDELLVVILIRQPEQFAQAMERVLGGYSGGVVAFYDLASNHVLVQAGDRAHPSLQQYVVAPHVPLDARTNLATHLVHEATHQLMCNSGAQARMADYPRWLSESLASYFEPADPFSRNGWRKPGGRNSIRHGQLQRRLNTLPLPDLRDLIAGDERFRHPSTAGDAYALAWGTAHFLLTRHREAFATYLRLQAARHPLEPTDRAIRLAEFESAFGNDWDRFNRQWIAFLRDL